MSESQESSSLSSGGVAPVVPKKKLPPKKGTPTLKKTVPQSDSKKGDLTTKTPLLVPKAALGDEVGKSSTTKGSAPKLVTKLSGGSVPKKDGKGIIPPVPKKKIPASRPSAESSSETSPDSLKRSPVIPLRVKRTSQASPPVTRAKGSTPTPIVTAATVSDWLELVGHGTQKQIFADNELDTFPILTSLTTAELLELGVSEAVSQELVTAIQSRQYFPTEPRDAESSSASEKDSTTGSKDSSATPSENCALCEQAKPLRTCDQCSRAVCRDDSTKIRSDVLGHAESVPVCSECLPKVKQLIRDHMAKDSDTVGQAERPAAEVDPEAVLADMIAQQGGQQKQDLEKSLRLTSDSEDNEDEVHDEIDDDTMQLMSGTPSSIPSSPKTPTTPGRADSLSPEPVPVRPSESQEKVTHFANLPSLSRVRSLSRDPDDPIPARPPFGAPEGDGGNDEVREEISLDEVPVQVIEKEKKAKRKKSKKIRKGRTSSATPANTESNSGSDTAGLSQSPPNTDDEARYGGDGGATDVNDLTAKRNQAFGLPAALMSPKADLRKSSLEKLASGRAVRPTPPVCPPHPTPEQYKMFMLAKYEYENWLNEQVRPTLQERSLRTRQDSAPEPPRPSGLGGDLEVAFKSNRFQSHLCKLEAGQLHVFESSGKKIKFTRPLKPEDKLSVEGDAASSTEFQLRTAPPDRKAVVFRCGTPAERDLWMETLAQHQSYNSHKYHARPASREVSDKTLEMLRVAFQSLSRSQLDDLASVMEPTEVAAGETIIQEGDLPDNLYVLQSGTVLVKTGNIELARLPAGSMFGEKGLVDGTVRTATVIAVDNCVVLPLSVAHFSALVAPYVKKTLAATVEVYEQRERGKGVLRALRTPLKLLRAQRGKNIDYSSFEEEEEEDSEEDYVLPESFLNARGRKNWLVACGECGHSLKPTDFACPGCNTDFSDSTFGKKTRSTPRLAAHGPAGGNTAARSEEDSGSPASPSASPSLTHASPSLSRAAPSPQPVRAAPALATKKETRFSRPEAVFDLPEIVTSNAEPSPSPATRSLATPSWQDVPPVHWDASQVRAWLSEKLKKMNVSQQLVEFALDRCATMTGELLVAQTEEKLRRRLQHDTEDTNALVFSLVEYIEMLV